MKFINNKTILKFTLLILMLNQKNIFHLKIKYTIFDNG